MSRLAGFLETHRLPLFVHKAARAILHCRTAVLGGHVMACPDGHGEEKFFYHSCGHRACPKCAFAKIEQWLAKKRDQMLGCDHFHLTFTLPSELYYLWRYNYETLANLFFLSVKETLFQVLADPKHMGALPGLHMALHTWNRAVLYCPHLHVLITGGGLAADGTWKSARRRDLISTDVLRQIFKAKFRDGFRKLLRRGKLQLPPDMNENDVEITLRRALRHAWMVDRRERYEYGNGVLTYLARYVRGGPLKESRLLSFDGDTVTFRKSRRREPFEAITLPVNDFIERLLRHVPPPNFRTVRSCGLYAPNAAAKRQLAQAALGQLPQSEPSGEISAEIPDQAAEDKGYGCCEVCGKKLVLVAKLPRPPPKRAATRRTPA